MLATLGLSLCLGLMSPELGVIGDGPMWHGAGTNAAQVDALVDVSNEPPNEPAAASLKGQNLEIRYWGGLVLDGVVKGNARIETSSKAPDASGPITQEITITASGGTLSLDATLSGSAESFPC